MAEEDLASTNASGEARSINFANTTAVRQEEGWTGRGRRCRLSRRACRWGRARRSRSRMSRQPVQEREGESLYTQRERKRVRQRQRQRQRVKERESAKKTGCGWSRTYSAPIGKRRPLAKQYRTTLGPSTPTLYAAVEALEPAVVQFRMRITLKSRRFPSSGVLAPRGRGEESTV